jgi:hypothetical protein
MSKPKNLPASPTSASVEDLINNIKDEQKRKDSFVLLEMMKKATGEEPVLWSSSVIGFGNKRYKSPTTGREVDWLRIGFSPRKAIYRCTFPEILRSMLLLLKSWASIRQVRVASKSISWKILILKF